MNSFEKQDIGSSKLNRIIYNLPTNKFLSYEVLGIPSILFALILMGYDLLFTIDENDPTSGSEFAFLTVLLILVWPIMYAAVISLLFEADLSSEAGLGALLEFFLIILYFIIQTVCIIFGYLLYFRKLKKIKQYRLQRKDYLKKMEELESKITQGQFAGAIEIIKNIEGLNIQVLSDQEKIDLISKSEELNTFGFPSRNDMETANSAGFDNFGEWTTAKSKGFTDKTTYQKSLAGGFEDFDEYSRMIHLGFKNKESYLSSKLDEDRDDIAQAYSEITEVFAPPIHLSKIAEKLNKSLDYINTTTLNLIARKLLLGKIHTGSSLDMKEYKLELVELESNKHTTNIQSTSETASPIVDVLQICKECGNSQSILVRTCTNCSNELPFCNLCKRGFGEKDVKVSCDNCSNLFHRQHLMAYLQSKGECPICQEKMTVT